MIYVYFFGGEGHPGTPLAINPRDSSEWCEMADGVWNQQPVEHCPRLLEQTLHFIGIYGWYQPFHWYFWLVSGIYGIYSYYSWSKYVQVLSDWFIWFVLSVDAPYLYSQFMVGWNPKPETLRCSSAHGHRAHFYQVGGVVGRQQRGTGTWGIRQGVKKLWLS